MLGFEKKDRTISFIDEFIDVALEKEYFNYEMEKAIKYMEPIVLILGFLYTLFAIPDYYIIKDKSIFHEILINRIVVGIVILFLYIILKKSKNYMITAYIISITEVIVIISFLMIFFNYENPDYLIQAFGMMIVILGFFLVPNKWINTVVASLFASILFVAISKSYFEKIEPSKFYAGVVYIFLVIGLSGISSYRNNYLKRKNYVDSKELLRIAETDSLTGIYNRGRFDHELQNWINVYKRYKNPLSLCMFDFDNFKRVNDNHGHITGDKVLVNSIALINKIIRKTDIFARWGGEEFVLLLPNTSLEEAKELVERIRLSVADLNHKEAGHVTCSFGLVSVNDNDNIVTLLNRVDNCLYSAKNSGKNRIEIQLNKTVEL
jgi:two-component system, cell cycle response regulator